MATTTPGAGDDRPDDLEDALAELLRDDPIFWTQEPDAPAYDPDEGRDAKIAACRLLHCLADFRASLDRIEAECLGMAQRRHIAPVFLIGLRSRLVREAVRAAERSEQMD